ncbi:hypothetical protein KI387_042254, partial [Taxus chinensis]
VTFGTVGTSRHRSAEESLQVAHEAKGHLGQKRREGREPADLAEKENLSKGTTGPSGRVGRGKAGLAEGEENRLTCLGH